MPGIEELKAKIKEDPVFAEMLKKIETYEGFQEKVREAGFVVTEEELRGMTEQDGAIADEDLDQVSGGVSQNALRKEWWIFW